MFSKQVALEARTRCLIAQRLEPGGPSLPDAAPEAHDAYRAWLDAAFGESFRALGFAPARAEADAVRLRRAALLQIVGGVADARDVVREAGQRCDAYLRQQAITEAAGDAEQLRAELAFCDGELLRAVRRRRALIESADPAIRQAVKTAGDPETRKALADKLGVPADLAEAIFAALDEE